MKALELIYWSEVWKSLWFQDLSVEGFVTSFFVSEQATSGHSSLCLSGKNLQQLRGTEQERVYV